VTAPLVTAAEVQEAAAGLRGVARRTPLVRVDALGAWLKLENLQPIGAFKIRGAYTAVRRLSVESRRHGVITYSSGNHGQALAFAAHRLGCRAVVVMPETAPAVKVEGVRRWGGEVVLAGSTSEDRRVRAEVLAAEQALTIVPPFDDAAIIAGQATLGLEIAQDLPDVETVVVPVGGGGLISGVVTGLAVAGSGAGVWGVEPTGAPKLARSLEAGRPVVLERTQSLADGLITLTVGARNFAQLQAHAGRLRGVVLVDDDSLRQAVHYLYRTCGLVVEPSGAATTAALRSGAIRAAGPTVLVVSGGNVDPALFDD
jgi:threonine dehydratase